jgi:hypothetical protein
MNIEAPVRPAAMWAHDPVWQYLAREVFSTADELARRFELDEAGSLLVELHVERDGMSDIGATLQSLDRQARLAGAFAQAVSRSGVSGLEGLPLPRPLFENEGGLLIVSIQPGSWRFGANLWGSLEKIAKSGPMIVVLMIAQLTGLSVVTVLEHADSHEPPPVVVEIDQTTAPDTLVKLHENLPEGSTVTVQIERPDGTILNVKLESPPEGQNQPPL